MTVELEDRDRALLSAEGRRRRSRCGCGQNGRVARASQCGRDGGQIVLLYNGRSGWTRRTAPRGRASVAVPSTLNVTRRPPHPELVLPTQRREGRRSDDGHVRGDGLPSDWTCAPYQLSDRPSLGEHVAWAESNAIVFANSVLGARTNRYGDFIDLCAAVTGRVPDHGLHTDEGRRATVRLRLHGVSDRLLDQDLLYPVLGHLLGRRAGTEVAAIDGLPPTTSEDRLKALGAAAASSGSVALFHAIGITPEGADVGRRGRPRSSRGGGHPPRSRAARASSRTCRTARRSAP